MSKLYCITTFFNPTNSSSLINNYKIFAERLNQQKVELITIELAFKDDDFQIDKSDNVYQLRSQSIMWQKERLINYGISKLPQNCSMFAWLDCDLLFPSKNWAEMAVERLQKADIIQLYKKVIHLPKGHTSYAGACNLMIQGVVWQKMIHKNWLYRRITKELPFSAPGFAWAARKSVFKDIGIYDKNIIGSGDTFLVDCYFNSWDIHGFFQKFNHHMKVDMMGWKSRLDDINPKVDYIPIDIYHLYHGSLKNRQYMSRHDILRKYDYNPHTDIFLKNGVFEYSKDAISTKQGMIDEIKDYFYNRKDDE